MRVVGLALGGDLGPVASEKARRSKPPIERDPHPHRIRGWRAVSDEGLQGRVPHKRSAVVVFSLSLSLSHTHAPVRHGRKAHVV